MHSKCCSPFETTQTHGKANQLPLKELSTTRRVIGLVNHGYDRTRILQKLCHSRSEQRYAMKVSWFTEIGKR